jgi:predicted nucleic acid-binding protein
MAAERLTFDTNILFYAVDTNAGDKHRIAGSLLQSAISHDCVLTLQALAELYNAICKKQSTRRDYVEAFIQTNSRIFPVVHSTKADLLTAIDMQRRHHLQFWDALLVATALRAGCTIFFSEDMHHTQRFNTLTILNPFQLTPTQLNQLLA